VSKAPFRPSEPTRYILRPDFHCLGCETNEQAFPNSTLASHLGPLISSENLYCSLPPSPSPSASSQPFQPPPPRRRSSLLKLFSHDSTSWSAPTDPPHLMLAAALASDRAKPLEREVQKMRLIKSRRELRLMKAAADFSADAHTQVN
jgi:intermediate cleaving peptidase 55